VTFVSVVSEAPELSAVLIVAQCRLMLEVLTAQNLYK